MAGCGRRDYGRRGRRMLAAHLRWECETAGKERLRMRSERRRTPMAEARRRFSMPQRAKCLAPYAPLAQRRRVLLGRGRIFLSRDLTD